jgi:ribonuclease VapC
MNAVLDASAVLAWLLDEPGAERVEAVLEGAAMSSLNWSEVTQKLLQRGTAYDGLRSELTSLGLAIVAFDHEDAERTAELWKVAPNLSLADRACLALSQQHAVPAYTADRLWATIEAGVAVRLIRS